MEEGEGEALAGAHRPAHSRERRQEGAAHSGALGESAERVTDLRGGAGVDAGGWNHGGPLSPKRRGSLASDTWFVRGAPAPRTASFGHLGGPTPGCRATAEAVAALDAERRNRRVAGRCQDLDPACLFMRAGRGASVSLETLRTRARLHGRHWSGWGMSGMHFSVKRASVVSTSNAPTGAQRSWGGSRRATSVQVEVAASFSLRTRSRDVALVQPPTVSQ
ncbi:hypothetical protein WA016_02522 [Myxococcus stipitatus]